MKLYYSPASPFVRKVMITLHETGLIAQTEILRVSGNAVDPGSMPVVDNPLGKIPTLVLNDGRALFDSRVITRFLDEQANAGLYPEDHRKWDCLTLEAVADGIADAAILCIYEKRLRPEEKWHEPWLNGQWAKVERALDHIESRCMPILHGDFHIAHVALAAALGYLDFRHPSRSWRNGRPELARWAESVAQRPSVAVTVPTD